jgi:hypothetical protein
LRRELLLLVLVTVLSAFCGCNGHQSEIPPPGGTVRSEAVLITALDTLCVYSRPDPGMPEWGILAPGDSIAPSARTSDGWLGFDPGVAQAGNSGSFRYRWIAPGGPYSVRGDPESLEVVWGPAAGSAYVMTFDPVPVHSEPDSLSAVLDSLPGNSAAVITDRVPGWFLVNPSEGPSPGTVPGWVREECVSVSG